MATTQERFSPAEWFADHARDYQLRDPAMATEGLSGPYVCRGDCLHPLVIEGDHHWYELGAQPEDGDVVLVKWSPAQLAAVRATPNGATYPEKYGMPVSEVAAKVYKWFAREPWIFEAEGAIELGNNEIIGVLRKAQRPATGEWLYGAVDCIQIGANAVTNVLVVTAASTTLIPPNPSLTYTTIATLTVGPLNADADVVITATGEWEFITGANTDTFELNAGVGISVGLGMRTLINQHVGQATNTTTSGSFASEQTFALGRGGTQTYYLSGIADFANLSSTALITDAVMKAEVIKK